MIHLRYLKLSEVGAYRRVYNHFKRQLFQYTFYTPSLDHEGVIFYEFFHRDKRQIKVKHLGT